MGNHYQRKALAVHRRRIAECLTQDLKGARNARLRRPGNGTLIDHPLCLTGWNGGRIPDLKSKRSIVDRCFAGSFVEVNNIRLMRIHQLNRADSYRPGPRGASSGASTGGTLK